MKKQYTPFLRAKWLNLSVTKQTLLGGTFLCIFYFLMPQENVAQSVRGLKNEDFIVKELIKPRKPLPDSIKTYQIVSEIASDLSIIRMDDRIIHDVFKFEFYEKRLSDADLILSVHVKNFTSTSELKSRTVDVGKTQPTTPAVDKPTVDTARKKSNTQTRKVPQKSIVKPLSQDSLETYYWYEETIIPQVVITLKDKFGKLIFSKQESQVAIYVSKERKSQQAAKIALDSEKKLSRYAETIIQSYIHTLETGANRVKNLYDYQSEVISLYRPKKNDSLFLKTIKAAQESLIKIGTATPESEIMERLKPHIDFFEKEIYDNIHGSNEAKRRYYAAALNLANLYRCVDDFDTALFYIRLLIKDNYTYCKQHTSHLVAMKERFEAYKFYKKMGTDLYETIQKQQQMSDSIRLEALKKNIKSEGHIILNKGNRRIDGSLLDFIKNFQNKKVVLKYKKRLRDPPTNYEFHLTDVKEIHTKEWHFAVVPYKKFAAHQIYLTEILFLNPKILLCRRIHGMDIINNQNVITEFLSSNFGENATVFVKKSDERNFNHLAGKLFSTFAGQLSGYLKDCPEVSRQVSYGYYTERQLLQAIIDYDSICGSKQSQNGINTETVDKKYKNSKGPILDLGTSTGMNNFNGFMGLNASVRLKKQLFVRGGVGFGSWGSQSSIGIKYDFYPDMRYRKGWSVAMGCAKYSGYSSLQIGGIGGNIMVISTSKDSINITSLPTSTIHFSTLYNSYFGKNTYFFVELGYSIGLRKKPWRTEISGAKPSNAQLWDIRIIQPGGIICGIGINFIIK